MILGKFLKQFSSVSFNSDRDISDLNEKFAESFNLQIKQAEIHNPWFTQEFIRYTLESIALSLEEDKLNKWLKKYPELLENHSDQKRIGLVLAGNIPLVGFHDMVSIIFSGHTFQGKLSSKDNKLFPILKEILCHINPEMLKTINFSVSPLKDIDAIIATGSNNSSRYFNYYFGKYPNIIRKNRNSIAILNGNESNVELRKLADDIFIYFGLGCRNVSKIFIPEKYDPVTFLSCMENYSYLYNHNKYANNYDYQKAVYLIEQIDHLDTGFLLTKEDSGYSSPVGVVFYERYDSQERLKSKIKNDNELIQCIISSNGFIEGSVNFGESQRPDLWDYSDNVDTLKFLINLYKN